MNARLVPFTLPLVAPLRLGEQTYTERSGLLLRVEKDGVVGWGEASPLPGFSPDSFDEAHAALGDAEAVATAAYDALAPDPHADLFSLGLPPSAQAAVEGAVLSLIARERGTTVARLLNPDAAETVLVNGLLPRADRDETLARARELAAAGYRAVKLKVGGDAREDAAFVEVVAETLGPGVALRLDANRAWSKTEALRFADALAGLSIDYVEEPVANPADLLAVAERLPVALDESLVGMQPDSLDWHAYARAVILKPMLLGGVVSAWRWAEAAQRRGMIPVVSAAFESGVGTGLNAALAAALGGVVPAGLDPYRWLARDVLPERPPIDGPVVQVREIEQAEDPQPTS